MLEVYTDGSHSPSSQSGGWAWVAVRDGVREAEDCGFKPNTTNNRMEILAILQALARYSETLTIVTDSQSSIAAIRANTRVSNNHDLVRQIGLLLKLRPVKAVTFRHVRGHCGNTWNEYADKLAVEARLDGHEKHCLT